MDITECVIDNMNLVSMVQFTYIMLHLTDIDVYNLRRWNLIHCIDMLLRVGFVFVVQSILFYWKGSADQ